MNETREQRAAAAKARMAALAAKFVGRTRDELATIRERLAQLADGDAAARSEIHHLAHRIAGTGATLGFVALSDCAARLERLSGDTAAAATSAEFALAQITGAVEALAAQLDAASPAGAVS